jgi:hypothetical protein
MMMKQLTTAREIDGGRKPSKHHAAAIAAVLQNAPMHPKPNALAGRRVGNALTARPIVIVATDHPLP